MKCIIKLVGNLNQVKCQFPINVDKSVNFFTAFKFIHVFRPNYIFPLFN